MFLGAVTAAAVLAVGEKAEPVVTLSEAVLEVVQKALWWVIRLAPLGTLGLIGKAVATDVGPIMGTQMHSVRANISLRALNMDNGEILATRAAAQKHVSRAKGRFQARFVAVIQ